jgi:5-methylcytosine-specific restriction endonuclease McrA
MTLTRKSPMSRQKASLKSGEKKLRARKCSVKGCKEPAVTFTGLKGWCSVEHGAVLAEAALMKKRAEKEQAERAQARVCKEALKSRSDHLKDAQTAFNAFIRARDAHLPCISCGRDNGSKVNAGHYLSVGSHPELRFNEDNCHKQCEHCNTYKSGNQAEYRPRLIDRIGLARVETLEGPQSPAKYTIDDLKALKATYKAKLKELRSRQQRAD